MKPKIKLAMLMSARMYARTMHPDDIRALEEFAQIVNPPPYPEKIDAAYMQKALVDAEACFTCWGTPAFSEEILAHAPHLRLILHGAGTPKAIATPAVWKRGIRVATCAPIIAIDVAETALGAIIYCLKYMGEYDAIARDGRWSDGTTVDEMKRGMLRLNRYLTIGILGASHVGRNMIRLLAPFGVRVKLYDPFVTEQGARALGTSLCSLEEAMACDVVSSHLPSLEATKNVVNRAMLARMKDGALFVNTSRGSVVDEEALCDELVSGRIRAYLDVFASEPLPTDSRLTKLPNVLLSPHISGGHTVNGGRERGAYLVEQLFSYHNLGRLTDEALEPMLETMA